MWGKSVLFPVGQLAKMGVRMGRLTVKMVKQLDHPGRYADGGGLYLHVRRGGSKQWLLRTTIRRKRVDLHVGSVSYVTLAQARDKAYELQKTIKAGGDPRMDRSDKQNLPYFEDAAEQVWKQNLPSWKNEKHKTEWISSIRRYANPVVGQLQLDEITSAHIMKVLSPIWLEKPETARRLKQRLGTVLDWAKASGYRDGDSPLTGIKDALPKQIAKPRHHKAMPWKEVPAFMKVLQDRKAASALALRFIILTATRSGETRLAEWSEIDFASATWTIPAIRMKMNLPHRVPLSGQAITILNQCKGFDETFIFPSATSGKPMSDMVFSSLYKRMGLQGLTTHGFRSSFRDWCSDYAKVDREVSEAALAHVRGDMTERAYARSDLFQRRIDLMSRWAEYACISPS
jgi:integrase